MVGEVKSAIFNGIVFDNNVKSVYLTGGKKFLGENYICEYNINMSLRLNMYVYKG
jgi:hypothetical protein